MKKSIGMGTGLISLTITLTLCLTTCRIRPNSQVEPESWRVDEVAWRSHIATLASDAYQGRAPGTPGEELTVAYLENALRQQGCLPLFAVGYRQTVPLLMRSPAGRNRLIVSGAQSETEISANDWVWISALPQPQIDIRQTAVVFAGFGIVAPSYQWDDYQGLDVKGKLVLALEQDPAKVGGDSRHFGGEAVTYYTRLRHKYEEAARRGAAGLLLVDSRTRQRGIWDVEKSSRQLPQYFLDDPAHPECTFFGFLSWQAASQMLTLAGLNLENEFKGACQPGYLGKNLPLTVTASGEAPYTRLSSSNVGGIIPGTGPSPEALVITAHWDHLGIGAAVNGDTIYNGACDNAVGLATLLELAQVLGRPGHRLKRSLVLLMPTAEERLLLGSEYFMRHSPLPLERMVANLNIDGLFPVGMMKDLGVIGHGHSDLDQLLAKEAARQGRTVTPDKALTQGYFFRLDLINFVKNGIPALHIGTGTLPVDPQAHQGIKETLGEFYHRPFDEYRPDVWDVRGMLADIEVIARMAWRLCQQEIRPTFRPGRDYREVPREQD